jgi:hypothetical protein
MANESIDVPVDDLGAAQLAPIAGTEVGGSGADLVSPEVTNVIPASGIVGPDDSIVFDVTDDLVLAFQVVFAEYPGLTDFDVVWTGFAFTPKYSTSSRLSIVGGWRYTINRDEGWRTAPALHVHAVDGGGNLDT